MVSDFKNEKLRVEKLLDNEKVKSFSIDITNRCNLKCLHCYNESGDSNRHNYDNELTDDELIKLATHLAEWQIEQICICGGETLLRFEILLKMVEILSKARVICNLVSNGLLLDDAKAKRLKAAGIYGVQISVDGLGIEHNLFRNNTNSFDAAIKALKILKENGIHTMVSLCPNKYNFRNFENYIKYISTLGCDSVRMMPLIPMGRGHKNTDLIRLSSMELFEFVQVVNKMKKKYKDIIEIEWGDPVEHIFLVLKSRRKFPVTFGVFSDGSYHFTPYLPIKLSNCKQYSPKEIWENGFKVLFAEKSIIDIMSECVTIDDFYEVGEKYIISNSIDWEKIKLHG